MRFLFLDTHVKKEKKKKIKQTKNFILPKLKTHNRQWEDFSDSSLMHCSSPLTGHPHYLYVSVCGVHIMRVSGGGVGGGVSVWPGDKEYEAGPVLEASHTYR